MLYPDAEPENADWIKTLHWPFPGVKTDKDLAAWLRESGMTMEHFKSLPIYQAWLEWRKKK